MHQMQFHVVMGAVDLVLAGVMEVELQQIERLPVEHDSAAGRGVDLDRVTVIDGGQRHALVGDLDRVQLRADRAVQVDRRLLHANLAGSEFRAQLAQRSAPVSPS